MTKLLKTKLLNLNNEKLFEELYYNRQPVGVEEGLYFNTAGVTVRFDRKEALKYEKRDFTTRNGDNAI